MKYIKLGTMIDGYNFEQQQQKRMLQREKLREELKKEFSEIFNTE